MHIEKGLQYRADLNSGIRRNSGFRRGAWPRVGQDGNAAIPILRKSTSTSRVALLGNDWKTLNADVVALEDRGHVILFEPTSLEVHRQAASWFWDQEIFDFVADHLHLIAQHSLRTYRHAWELKRAGLNWRQAVLSRYLAGPALVVARLKTNRVLANEAERVRAFVQAGAGCRATYFHHAKSCDRWQTRRGLH